MTTQAPLSLRERIAQEKNRRPTAEFSLEINSESPFIREPLESPRAPVPSPHKERPIRYQKPSASFVESKNETSSEQFHRGPFSRRSYRRVAWSILAAVVDGLVLVAISCFLLLSMRWVTPFKLTDIWNLAQQKSIFSLGFAVGWIYFYMVLQRVFLGFSIGEWTCSLRLGHLHQRFGSDYSLWVLVRMTVITATGFVPLPLLSLILGIDCAGFLSRLPLVESHEWNQAAAKGR